MAMGIRDDFYLFHLSAFKIVRVRIVIFEDTFKCLYLIICQPDVSVSDWQMMKTTLTDQFYINSVHS